MFTGLVERIGVLRSLRGSSYGRRAFVATDLGPLVLGESISVNGACLTVDVIATGGFEADLSSETVAKTTLGALSPGARVHLERALAVGDRLGGHLVLGHVDGVGDVLGHEPSGDARRLSVRAPRELAHLIAPKGSVTIDGVSLTVNDVRDAAGHVDFDVMLVPHTLERTNLGALDRGSRVNLECDVLARYLARQQALRAAGVGWNEREEFSKQAPREPHADPDGDQRILDKLARGGFL